MNNLKDFIKNKQIACLPSTGEIKSAITKDLSIAPAFLTLTISEKEEFTNKVTQAAKSDEVLTEFSEALGKPKESESEEDFIKRGKSILANILRKKLMK